ncbi:helix-turn-helix domain-containing protein [Marininema halotolerans]|uniref:HTH cro/C1-type domain-containing protein n=1 Tax=Marininema halotolerans TaxID=1155944 RepID=A0A1I6NSK7_9BACL|nr:helix-turn-helix domain-containing protein [Marininema halotolerans]SFS30927.1 protein of unknown function [Marininema halotolerans]
MWVEIGNQLRQAREKAGLSLEDLQNQTQIDMGTLKALESGELNKISSPFFVRSYIRTVAKKVNLEPTYLLKHYRPVQDGSEEEDGSKGADTQQTGVFSPMTKQADPRSTTDQEPSQNTQSFQPIRMSDGSDEDYDPFHNMKGNEALPEEPQASDLDEGELPSRSATSKSKKWSVSDLTQTLKMKALNVPVLKKEEEQDSAGRNGEETSPSLPLDEGGELPPRSRGRRRTVSQDTMTLDSSEMALDDRSEQTIPPRDSFESEPADPYKEEERSLVDEPYDQGASPSEGAIPSRSESYTTMDSLSSSGLPPRGQSMSSYQEEPKEMEDSLPSRSERSESTSTLPAIVPPGEISRSNTQRLRRVNTPEKASGRLKSAGLWIAEKGLSIPKTAVGRWVALVIILIPVTVWAATSNFMGDSPHKTKKVTVSSVKEKGSKSETGKKEQGTAQLLAVNEGPGLSEYQLSQPDAVSFRFKAKGRSWLQIRKQKNAEEGYLKDVTLKDGETFPFESEKGEAKDLWVTIGSPDQVDVTINGQSIKANKTLHVIVNK